MGKKRINRLTYLDWLRGIGALIMLQGHVFHSFLRPELREDAPYLFSQFAGGMPPAIFLFLTGVTFAFLMDSTEKKMLPAATRLWTALNRSGYLFLLAFAFRFQMWIFSGGGQWTDLFRVDILNCMGFAMAVFTPLTLLSGARRLRAATLCGFAIVFAAPLISLFDTAHLPSLLRNYVVPDYNFFGFFPWAAYLAFGIAGGTLIRVIPHEQTDRAMQWAAIFAGVLIVVSQYAANLPYSVYSKTEFWLNSPAQVLTKVGVTLLLMAAAFLWTRYGAGEGWSWVRQFGTTSLLVYWVHIELVYGRWLYFWKNNLNVPQTVAAALGVILLMLALSTARTNWPRLREWLNDMRWRWTLPPTPDRVPGD